MIPIAIRGWRLAKDAFATESKSYRRRQQRKILWFCLCNPGFASRWLGLLYSEKYKSLVASRPRLYVKPFRVYMSVRWNKKRRRKVILDTYTFLKKNKNLFEQIVENGNQVLLAAFNLKNGDTAFLYLGYDERFRKEGEIVISLSCEALGGLITAASFSFEEDCGAWVCRIGCVQGFKNDNQKSIHFTQKEMNGLRPKSLMTFAVMELAHHLGIQSVYGSGQSIQAFKRKHIVYIRRFHKISFDYDKFWMESDGKLAEEGWYLLPDTFPRKSIEELDTSKRATYRRRYQMMDKISEDIAEAVRKV